MREITVWHLFDGRYYSPSVVLGDTVEDDLRCEGRKEGMDELSRLGLADGETGEEKTGGIGALLEFTLTDG